MGLTNVGRGGDIYLENIPSGSYEATLYKGTKECSFIIVIPESEDMFVEIGEFTCDIK